MFSPLFSSKWSRSSIKQYRKQLIPITIINVFEALAGVGDVKHLVWISCVNETKLRKTLTRIKQVEAI